MLIKKVKSVKIVTLALVMAVGASSAFTPILAQNKTEQEYKASSSEKPYLVYGTQWKNSFKMYNAYTGTQIKYKEWSTLLNSTPGNENFRKKDIAYTTMYWIGITATLTSLFLFMPNDTGKIPTKQLYAGIGLAASGLSFIGIFGSLQNYNRKTSIDRYHTYTLGIRKNF